MSKRRWIEVHARKRAKERFDFNLTQEEHSKIIKLIQTGKAHFITEESCTRSRFEIIINNKKMHVVYDKTRKMIVTFLYPEVA